MPPHLPVQDESEYFRETHQWMDLMKPDFHEVVVRQTNILVNHLMVSVDFDAVVNAITFPC